MYTLVQIVEDEYEMLNYPDYPSSPSISDNSSLSYRTLSPALDVSENSSSSDSFSAAQALVSQKPTVLSFQGTIQERDGIYTGEHPYLEITEQPVDKCRFRYKSEIIGTRGCIKGVRSNITKKTYPSVKLHNHEGPAIIRCSIWQIDHGENDFGPHAHTLIMRNYGTEEADDPHELWTDEDKKHEVRFFPMVIIYTPKKKVLMQLMKKKTMLMKEAASRNNRSLSKREEMEIKGTAQAESRSINLDIVCFRFDAFYATDDGSRIPICPPTFSHCISNMRGVLTRKLKIFRIDQCTSPAYGGQEIFILVEGVIKRNIEVRFYELDENNEVSWEAYGKFTELDIHHQYAIVFRTPPYKNQDIRKPVNVFMELVRPSDNARSESRIFTYIPALNSPRRGSKRCRPNDFDNNEYNTNSIGQEIPCRLQKNIRKEVQGININKIKLDNEKLDKLLNNVNEEFSIAYIDSKEFNNLFNTSRNEYEKIYKENIFKANISNNFAMLEIKNHISLLSLSNDRLNHKKNIIRVFQEIAEFLKREPSVEDIIKHLGNYLLNFSENYNVFHMAVINGNVPVINFFLKFVIECKKLELLNIPTKTGQGTLLHLAVLYRNMELVKALITECQADISLVDGNLNTPVHIAAEDTTGQILECLLKSKNIKTHIDINNNNGDTPLHVAVKRSNLKAVKLLYHYGADVNSHNHMNGYTPLRFAVENRDMEMIKFLMNETNANPVEPDNIGVHPLQVINQIEYPTEIIALAQKYTAENKISCDNIYIKEEPEDEESEDKRNIFEKEVKSVGLSLGEDYENILQNITQFTDECLNDISAEIDSSGQWQNLARLLDIEHLLRTETTGEKSPGKRILTIATQFATIKEIRGFLEDLDETRAVKAIDRMVLHFHIKNS